MSKKSLFAIVTLLFVISFASLAQDMVPQINLLPQKQNILADGGLGIPDITVNSTLDAVDANPGDGACADASGNCTLRAAIMESNAFPLPQSIHVPAGTYLLTIPGTDEDAAATGDLDITDKVLITGDGQGQTLIDGNDLDRVFHSLVPKVDNSDEIIISNLTIQGGNAPYGGGIFIETEAHVTLRFVTLRDNYAYGHYPCGQSAGAALYTTSYASLMFSTVTENRTPDTNLTSSYGAVSGVVEVWFTSIINNQTDWAMIVDRNTCSGEVTMFWIQFSLIANNSGGGLRLYNPMIVANSTISDNSVGVRISYSDESANEYYHPSFNQTTIAHNGSKGLIIEYPVLVDMDYSIISGHTQNCDVSGALTINPDYGFEFPYHNIFSDASCPAGPTDIENVDPLLLPLADNGGYTLTRRLPETSPATDNFCDGSSVVDDQRGHLPTGVTRCSIGAYEYFEYPGPGEPFAPGVYAYDLQDDTESNSPQLALTKYLNLIFVGPMFNPLGDSDLNDVTNPDNYRLLMKGPNGQFDTDSCEASQQGDDLRVPIKRVVYGAPWPSNYLDYFTPHYTISGGLLEFDAEAVGGTEYFLPVGDFRFIACDSLQDIKGVHIDADGDGYSGGNAIHDFTNIQSPQTQVVQVDVFDGGTTPSATIYPNTGGVAIPAYVDDFEVEFSVKMDSYPLMDLANVRLVQGGTNGTVETQTCDTVVGDDVSVSIADSEVGHYSDYPEVFTASIPYMHVQYAVNQSLSANAYRLILCDDIKSLEGVPLNGDSDSIPGGNFMLDFVTDGFVPPLPTPPAPTLNDYSDVLVALNLPTISPVPAGTVFQIERTTGGSASLVGSADVGTVSFVDSNLTCETAYRYRVRLYDAAASNFSEWSDYLDVTTANCVTSLQHTFGLYKEGQWLFYAVDGYHREDVRFAFGEPESGWTALVGDWNGDGLPGIGLYKEGAFLLRDLDGDSVVDISFNFGPLSGAIPVVGDWDGNGTDTIGVFSSGSFQLRNSNDAGLADLTFNLGSASSIPLSGDWDGDGTDSVGYFENNTFYLATAGAVYTSFSFGPLGWSPVFGDWNGDLTDTIGLYNNGLWRLRNTNSIGPVDYGFSYGDLTGGWQPLAFDGDTSVLNRLFAVTVPTPRVPVIPGPGVNST
ncbi:MAG: hypothetical protein H6670_16120 [Anaerolineaceae bacterium]|nr:hypothetical protein [Anaerolineaceae bacterium]